jgi:hypothetical protein
MSLIAFSLRVGGREKILTRTKAAWPKHGGNLKPFAEQSAEFLDSNSPITTG